MSNLDVGEEYSWNGRICCDICFRETIHGSVTQSDWSERIYANKIDPQNNVLDICPTCIQRNNKRCKDIVLSTEI